MKETIAFKNNGGFWESRYSFASSCIAWVKDILLTSPVASPAATEEQGSDPSSGVAISWRHDESAGTNNSFFGSCAVPSGVQVAFNDNPSANKMYKAFSLESPDYRSLEKDAVSFFVVNNSTGNAIPKNIKPRALKEKGGILYGSVGDQIAVVSLSNVELMGVCSFVDPNGEFFILDGSMQSSFSGGEVIFTSNPTQDFGTGNNLPLASNYNSSFNSFSVFFQPTEESLVTFIEGLEEAQGETYSQPTNLTFGLNGSHDLAVGEPVFAVYLDKNGEQPKGQFADLAILFGSEDFEVYAINVDYEPTALDHNG